MSKWLHRLTEKDVVKHTAICSIDGVVKIYSDGRTSRCIIAVRNRKKATLYHYKYKHKGAVRPERCEVCGSDKRICFDHDHATGVHRGWLCDRCNRILGAARDDPKILHGLADYLDK